MVGDCVLREEVRVAGGDDALARQEAGVAVVGVEPVSLPRVVTEHDVRPELADHQGDAARAVEVAVELAVDVVEEPHLAGAIAGEPSCRLALLDLATRRERADVGVGVPRPLRAVGAHEVVDDASVGGPLGERRAAPELDVVGVRADRQRRPPASRGRGS